MKIKYTILLSLSFTILYSSASSASGGEATVNVSEKPPAKGFRGMKRNPLLWPISHQRLDLPGKMIPLPERSGPKNPPAIPAQ